MSDKTNFNSNNKLKRTKEKNYIKKSTFSHINSDKNAKTKQKNINLKSKTPIKGEVQKNSNKENMNKTTAIIPPNNNYDINNNISINININMNNTEDNTKSHQSISGIQNKNMTEST